MFKPFFILLVLLCSSLAAQTLSLTSPSTTVRPGKSITLRVELAGAVNAAGLQWALNSPLASTGKRGKAGAGKVLYVQPPRAILVGVNDSLIQTGVVAVYTVPVPATQPAGPLTFRLTDVLAVTAAGVALFPVAGPPVVVQVQFSGWR